MSDASFNYPVEDITFSFGIKSDAKAYIEIHWNGALKDDRDGCSLTIDDREWMFFYKEKALCVSNTSPAGEIEALRPIIKPDLVGCLLVMNSCFASRRPFALTKGWVTRIAEAIGIPINTAFDVELSEVFNERG